jgi:putative flippase GtrA
MNTDSLAHSRSISWFTLIGALAAAVHYVVAVSLEAGLGVAPAWANPCGFLLAFPVSYIGHRQFSFAAQKASHQQAFPRFLLVACGGFLSNQFLLLSALRLFALPFWLTLAIVMVVVAVTTYMLSRFWAFK